MEISELISIIARGEDSKNQFKADFSNTESLASELVAFSNSGGGRIFLGVSDDGTVSGLNFDDVGRLNQLISNAASQSVHPPVTPLTENILHPDGIVLLVNIPVGISKPYMDNKGAIWVKNAGDKRKITSREEIQRMFQSSGLVHADETPVTGFSVADIDLPYFKNFFQKKYGESFDTYNISLPELLKNMNLANDINLKLAGALLFAKQPQFCLPSFISKAVCYPGTEIDLEHYIDSKDITGKLADSFHQSFSFVLNNLQFKQGSTTINSTGESEIPQIVLEELLVNALIHRDYFISAPIRLFIFNNRIEVISPGNLPNNLTIENIKSGNSNMRNPILASFATSLLPYRGIGSGIVRTLKAYPNINFIDDRDANVFKVIIYR
jgi:ATP-dependent DNA helicase RecG